MMKRLGPRRPSLAGFAFLMVVSLFPSCAPGAAKSKGSGKPKGTTVVTSGAEKRDLVTTVGGKVTTGVCSGEIPEQGLRSVCG